MIAYLDSSALAKLVVTEDESQALREELSGWPERTSSVLARVELLRLARRVSHELVTRASEVLSRVALMRIDDAIVDLAVELSPPTLRSLDAIHVASAVALGSRLGVLVSYDARMLAAADDAGLATRAPR